MVRTWSMLLDGFRKALPYQDLIDLQAGILTKHLTSAEMGEIAAFYRTTTGEKALQVMPEAMQDAMASIMSGGQQSMKELIDGLKPYMHLPEEQK